MSGLAGDPEDEDVVWAVSDSVLAQAYLYRIDVSETPAVITERLPVGGVDVADQADGDYDLEGVAARPEGGFWFASEGRTNVGSSRPNLIVRTDAAGAVLESFPLPESLVAAATSSGFEGVAVTGSEAGGDETVWVAIQREWARRSRLRQARALRRRHRGVDVRPVPARPAMNPRRSTGRRAVRADAAARRHGWP